MSKFFKQEAKPTGSLLITILAEETCDEGLPHLMLPNLVLRHGIKNTERYANTSTIIISSKGKIFDLNQTTDDKLGVDNLELEMTLSNLRKKSWSLSEAKFDKVLIIGNMNRLSPVATISLKKFYLSNIRDGGLIRVQICNFTERCVEDADGNESHNFIQEIIPEFCALSIPSTYSILSDKDTRTIDLTINTKDFERSEVAFSSILRTTNSDEHIGALFENIVHQLKLSNVTNVSIVKDNGERISILNKEEQSEHVNGQSTQTDEQSEQVDEQSYPGSSCNLL